MKKTVRLQTISTLISYVIDCNRGASVYCIDVIGYNDQEEVKIMVNLTMNSP